MKSFAIALVLLWTSTSPAFGQGKVGLDDEPKSLALPAPPPPSMAERAMQLHVPEPRPSVVSQPSFWVGLAAAIGGAALLGVGAGIGTEAVDAKKACPSNDAACAASAHDQGVKADSLLIAGGVALGAGIITAGATTVVTLVKKTTNHGDAVAVARKEE